MSTGRYAAREVRKHIEAKVAAMARHPVYAEVVDTDPIQVELHDTELTMEAGDDLTLTQHVRWYDSQWGVEIGDTLLVRQMSNGDWVATDVISETEVSG